MWNYQIQTRPAIWFSKKKWVRIYHRLTCRGFLGMRGKMSCQIIAYRMQFKSQQQVVVARTWLFLFRKLTNRFHKHSKDHHRYRNKAQVWKSPTMKNKIYQKLHKLQKWLGYQDLVFRCRPLFCSKLFNKIKEHLQDWNELWAKIV